MGACFGDDGGPLICQDTSSSSYILHGINSFGLGCGIAELPGVYTRVSKFVDWTEAIKTNTGELFILNLSSAWENDKWLKICYLLNTKKCSDKSNKLICYQSYCYNGSLSETGT